MPQRSLWVTLVVWALLVGPTSTQAQGAAPPPPPPPPGEPAPPAGYQEIQPTATPAPTATPVQPRGGFVVQPTPAPQRNSIDGAYSGADLEVAYFGTSIGGVDVRYIGTQLGAQVAVSDNVELFARWGFGTVHAETSGGGDSEDGLIAQNPFVGVNFLMNASAQQTYRVGAGLGLPLASTGSSFGDALARDIGIGTSALWDLHLWLPDTVALEFHIENVRRMGALVVSGRTQLVMLAYTSDTVSDNSADFAWNWDLGVGGSWDPAGSGIGIRIRSAWIPTAEDVVGTDLYQIALEPYVEQWFGDLGASLRFTMNMDEPYGFAFDEEGVWALHFGLRYRNQR